MKITDHATERLKERSNIDPSNYLCACKIACKKGTNKVSNRGVYRRGVFRCEYLGLKWVFNHSRNTLITVVEIE